MAHRNHHNAASRPSIYQTVTDRIISNLKAGVIPWEKPWKTPLYAGGPFPRNFSIPASPTVASMSFCFGRASKTPRFGFRCYAVMDSITNGIFANAFDLRLGFRYSNGY